MMKCESQLYDNGEVLKREYYYYFEQNGFNEEIRIKGQSNSILKYAFYIECEEDCIQQRQQKELDLLEQEKKKASDSILLKKEKRIKDNEMFLNNALKEYESLGEVRDKSSLNTKLGNDVLFYDQHVSQLLGDLYGDDFRVPYQLKDIGIDIREEKGQKVPDLYKYEGEEIVICPEPITFYREYDDVSDRTELVQKRFIEALEDANRFKKIVLNQGPTVEVCGDTLRVWRGKTISGINLRPGACENGDTLNKPVKLSDDNVHGLIIGRTGAGKSVYINNLILSLISEYAPWELDLYLADFKKVELSRYMNDDVQNENTSFTPHVNACAATSEIRYVLSMFL